MKYFLQIITIALLTITLSQSSNAQCNAIIMANDSTICNGDSTALSAIVVISCSPWNFQWSPGGATTGSINAKPTATTSYILTATDSGGIIHLDTFTVFVANCTLGCGVAASSANNAICNGDSTILTAMSPTNCPQTVTYNWMPGNSPGQHYSVTPTATTTYTVTMIDGGGDPYTDTIRITVVNCSNCSVSIFSTDTNICSGNTAVLNAAILLTCPTLTLTWMPGNISGGTATVNPTATTTYTVMGFDGVNTFTDTFTVHIIPCPWGVEENNGITEFNSIFSREEEKLILTFTANNSQAIETSLMNITGQTFYRTHPVKNGASTYKQTYSTAGLSKGIYIVTVRTNKGVLSRKIALY